MKILKRNGNQEDYLPQKINRVVQAAGLNAEEANQLVKLITRWLLSLNKETVSTREIRDKVVSEMAKANPQAADAFIQYEKYKKKTLKMDGED